MSLCKNNFECCISMMQSSFRTEDQGAMIIVCNYNIAFRRTVILKNSLCTTRCNPNDVLYQLTYFLVLSYEFQTIHYAFLMIEIIEHH